MKRLTALLLTAVMLLTGDLSVLAQENTLQTEEITAQESEASAKAEGQADLEQEYNTQTEKEIDSKQSDDVQVNSATALEQENTTQAGGDDFRVLYTYINQSNLSVGEEQKLLIGFDKQYSIDKAVLTIKNTTTGKLYEVEASQYLTGGFYFTFQPSEKGKYQPVSLTYTQNGKQGIYTYAKDDVSACFGVGIAVKSNADAYVTDETSTHAEDAQVVMLDENGNTLSKNNIRQALTTATNGTGKAKTNGSNLVVVLDPGHGGYDGGASANGLKESDINLKIAKYCKAELEKYSGVKVYMTRTTDVFVELSERVRYAVSKGANVFVSIHINASGVGAVGAEVWYPNGSYNSAVNVAGYNLSVQILEQLQKLGLVNRGAKIRNSDGDYYPDGSVSDYYSVIRNSKYNGIPGIIIEHGFIDSTDAANFLNSDAKLKKLGVADATGIAKYYGLGKSVGKVSNLAAKATGFNGIKITWKGTKKATGYYVYRKNENGKWVKLGKTSKTSYVDYTGACSTKYTYNVKAYNGNTKSKYADKSVTAKTGSGKITLTEIKTGSFNTVTLSWKSKKGATGYEIYRKKDNGEWTLLGDTTELSYKDETATPGYTYTYSVKGYRLQDSEKIYGAFNEKGITVTLSAKKPSLKEVTKGNFNEVKISWKKVKGAKGYQIYRKEKNSTWKKIATTKDLSFSDTDTTCGTEYQYKIRAYRSYKGKKYYGKFSKIKTITTNQAAVTKLSAEQDTFNQTKLTWKKVKGTTKYQIYRKEADGGWKKIAVTKATSYVDKTTECGKTYQFRVRAYKKVKDKKIYGKYKNVVTFTTNQRKAKLSGNELTQSGVKLSWKKVKDATGYIVYRKADGEKWKKIKTTKSRNYTDTKFADGITYSYAVAAYREEDGVKYLGAKSKALSLTAPYRVLGKTNVTVAQMMAYFNRTGRPYPADVYTSKGAATLQDFCQIVYDYSVMEGVNAEVVFAQICKETGYLQFGGDVKAEQCNFAGIGATGNGAPGNTFASVAAGVHAQVRHLKLYASTNIADVPNDGVDPRYFITCLGKAPYVEWLSIPHNPYGTGWAASEGYSRELLADIWRLRGM